jgi:magnesium-transporting ATPase (P-type)
MFIYALFSGTAIAILTVVIMFVRFSISKYAIDRESWHISHAQKFVTFIITGITVLVVAVPEGLPLAVTLSLAYSVKVISIPI